MSLQPNSAGNDYMYPVNEVERMTQLVKPTRITSSAVREQFCRVLYLQTHDDSPQVRLNCIMDQLCCDLFLDA